MNKSKFKKDAKPLAVTVNGEFLKAEVKVFKKGTLGWFVQQTIEIQVGGETVEAQVNLNITIPGSK